MVERTLVTATKGFTKKHLLNSKNGVAFRDRIGIFNITAAALAHVSNPDAVKEEDRERDVAILVDEEGVVLTGISDSINDTVCDLCGYEDEFFEDGTCTVQIMARKSKSDREFLSLQIL